MKTKIILLFLIFNIFDKCQANCVCFATPSCETVRKINQQENKAIAIKDVKNLNENSRLEDGILHVNVHVVLQSTTAAVILTRDNFTFVCDHEGSSSYMDPQDHTPIVLISLRNEKDIFGVQFLTIYKDLEILALSTYQPEWFKYLKSLRELYITSAKIESLEAKVFQDLIHLEILDLSNNQIKTIHSDSFANLPSLVTLILNGNNITSIDQNLFDILPIRNLIMNDNACASGGINNATKTDFMNVLSDCYKLYRPRLIINENQNYQWMSEINALKKFVQVSREKYVMLTEQDSGIIIDM